MRQVLQFGGRVVLAMLAFGILAAWLGASQTPPPTPHPEAIRLIRPGETLAGTIHTNADHDEYYFDALAGQRAWVSVTRRGGLLVPELALMGPDGALLAQAEDVPASGRAAIEGVSLPLGSRYRVVVSSRDSRSRGDYAIALQLTAAGS